MKKTIFFMALALVAGMSLTGCKDDTEPRLQKPTEFSLNTPPMANQTYVLTDKDGIDLSVSQPNYGLGVTPQYQTQISYTEDFAKYENIQSTTQQAQIQLSGTEVAQAMCRLMGYVSPETEDQYVPGVRKVYFRVRSFFQYCDYSSITTKNVVALSVVPFPSVRMPGRLYVIGDVNGWDINNGEFFVQENADEIGSGKYYGDIEMAAAQAASGFRFYAELGKWGDNGALPSVGSNPNDGDNATVVLEDGKYTGPCVKGKGNWNITNWPGGKMHIEVDMSNVNSMTVTFSEPKK